MKSLVTLPLGCRNNFYAHRVLFVENVITISLIDSKDKSYFKCDYGESLVLSFAAEVRVFLFDFETFKDNYSN